MLQNVQDVASQAAQSALVLGFKYLGAALCMAIGGMVPAVGEAQIVTRAIEGMARQPELEGALFRAMIVGQSILETIAIYCLIVSIILLLVV
jgi:F-type H+-transporting ATPase subunit c